MIIQGRVYTGLEENSQILILIILKIKFCKAVNEPSESVVRIMTNANFGVPGVGLNATTKFITVAHSPYLKSTKRGDLLTLKKWVYRNRFE